jgi:hypothetical protein
MMRVFLTQKELEECIFMGAETVRICKGQKANPRIKEDKEKRSRASSNGLGFKGERAFARAFKLEPTQVTVHADDGIDYVLADGRTVDVKATGLKDKDLIFDSFDSFRSDIGVLGYSHDYMDCVDFLGWITKERFMEVCDEKDYGHGLRKYVREDQLFPMKDLLTAHLEGLNNA